MIFYKALKYKIFEFCIDSLCNNVLRNFNRYNNTIALKDLRRGMRVSTIERNGEIYIDCYIEFINRIDIDPVIYNLHGIIGPMYYAYIMCRDTNIPQAERYMIDERTGQYLFEMKLFDGECKITV